VGGGKMFGAPFTSNCNQGRRENASIECPHMARILISGASGLIGRALASTFISRGYEVLRLVWRPPRDRRELQWDPEHSVSPELVSGFDAVIHLSGESVTGRWTTAKKQRIRYSRVVSTQNLSRALAQAEKPPQTFICASAIGYYGNRGDEVLTEESLSGTGFLAEVSREWEGAGAIAVQAGIRTSNLRIGIVLSRDGGALKQMLLPFRLGLGGKIGSGRQWFSWIHIDDLVAAVLHVIDGRIVNHGTAESGASLRHLQPTLSPGLLSGPINMVAPNPVTNADFTKRLAGVLHRPAIVPIPASAVRLAFGEFGREGLLSSARVIPQRLLNAGFQFKHPELEESLAQLLGRRSPAPAR
jgi:uncharacterized protein